MICDNCIYAEICESDDDFVCPADETESIELILD